MADPACSEKPLAKTKATKLLLKDREFTNVHNSQSVARSGTRPYRGCVKQPRVVGWPAGKQYGGFNLKKPQAVKSSANRVDEQVESLRRLGLVKELDSYTEPVLNRTVLLGLELHGLGPRLGL